MKVFKSNLFESQKLYSHVQYVHKHNSNFEYVHVIFDVKFSPCAEILLKISL